MSSTDAAQVRSLLPDATADDEAALIRFAEEAPFVYGPWRHFKGLYKDAETAASPAVLGALIARLDEVDPLAPGGAAAVERPTFTGVVAAAFAPPLACVTGSDGFAVLDLSDPTAPKVLSRENPGWCRQVALSGGRAYVEMTDRQAYGRGRNISRLLILDLSDPARPVDIGAVEVRELKSLAIHESWLLLVEAVGPERGQLRIFDVSRPDNPDLVASIAVSEARGVAVSGRRAYVSSGTRHREPTGVHVFDLSNPRAALPRQFHKVDAAGILIDGRLLPISDRGREYWRLLPDAAPPEPAPASPPTPPSPPSPSTEPPRQGFFQRLTSFLGGAPPIPTGGTPQTAAPRQERLAHQLISLPHGARIDTALEHQGYLYALGTNGLLVVFPLTAERRLQPAGMVPVCTSPALTNLLCRKLDRRLAGAAGAFGFTYTRYADDLVFSHPQAEAPLGALLALARSILESEGFTVNEAKTAVMRPQHRQVVTGVVVNGDAARISREDLRRFRAFLHHVETEGADVVSQRLSRNAQAYASGYLAFIHMVNPEQAARLQAKHPWLTRWESS